MSRPVGLACAAGLLVLSGCSLGSFFASVTGSSGKPQVIAGSVDQTSVSLQAMLSRANVAVNISRDGSDVRLAGTTPSGKKFALLLQADKTGPEERTVVAVEWPGGADERFWSGVVTLLLSPPPPAPSGYPDPFTVPPMTGAAAAAK
jgi:hypothetical protein